MMTELMNAILTDSIFSSTDKEWLMKFNADVTKRIESHGVNFGITMFSIADTIGMDLTAIHKEGPFMFALWVILLSHFQQYLKLEDMKYPTFEQFLQAYQGWFVNEPESELQKLWMIANWMNILFKLITARKNKGLAMQVVPKLIEGWDVKYVTGSGQTRFTANRVHIFEIEGNTKANHRAKGKSGSKRGRGEGRRPSQPSKREMASMIPKRRRRGTKSKQKGHDDDSMSEDDVYYVYNKEGSDMEDGDMTNEEEDSSINEDIKEVYDEFVLDPDGTGESEMELIRDISNMRFDNELSPMNRSNGSPAVPMKREATWTEIDTSLNEPTPEIAVNYYPIVSETSIPETYPSYHSSANNSYTSSNMAEFAPPNLSTLSTPMINDIFNGYNVNMSE